MKKLTAILLIILTIAFVGIKLYSTKGIFKSDSPINITESQPQGILPGGCVVGTKESFADKFKDYLSEINFIIAYIVLTFILSILTVGDKAKKQLHTDEEYDLKIQEINEIQAKLEESNKTRDELTKELEANKVDSEKIAQLEQNLDEAKIEANNSKQSLNEKIADYAKLKAEFDSVNSKAENLEKDNKGIRREVDKLNSKLKTCQSEKDDLKTKIIDLGKQLEDQITELKAQAANIKGGKEAIPPAAYQILYLLQKEGRLIDLLNEDISSVEDEDLGGAVRPVLEGCAKLLKDRLVVEPVLKEEEGNVVTVDEADPETIKLSGNVPEKGPYKGELIHHGWRLKECNLPELVDGWKGNVIAPAEIEIS